MVGMEINESISSVKRASAAGESIMQLAVSLVQPSINYYCMLINVFRSSIYFAVA